MPCLAPAQWILSCDGNHQRPSGERILTQLIGSGQFIHPMHLHGQPFTIVSTNGNPVPEGAQLTKDTVLIGEQEKGGGLSMIINIAP